MWKAALKSLLGRKVRLLMSTFAIVLGVGFVSGTLIFSDTLSRSFTAIFASTVGDVVVQPDGAGAMDGTATSTVSIPANLVDELADVDGATRADGNVVGMGVFVIDDAGKPIGGQGAPALAGNWNDAPAGHGIKGLVIEEGREPTGPDEVVLDEFTAEKSGYDIGDEVQLETALARGSSLRPTLVGVAAFGEGGSLGGASLAIFGTATAQDYFLDGKDAYNTIWVTAEDDVSQEELRDRVDRVLPDGLEAVTGDTAADDAATELQKQIEFITIFLLIFAVISLVVGSFLIVNTFSILVAQRSRELALFRALGASKKQVKRSVLLEALVLGLIGSTIGLGVGILLFLGIRAAFGSAGLDIASAPMVFESRTVIANYAVGLVVTMVAAWIPARRTSKIPPIAALRDDVAMPESSLRRRSITGSLMVLLGAVAMGAGLFTSIPRAGWVLGAGTLAVLLGVAALSPILASPLLKGARVLYARVFGAVGNLAGNNALRNPRRTAATASALMIGLTLCVTMAIVGSSAKASVDQTVKENFVGDYVISSVYGTPFSASIADRVENADGVSSVTRLRFGIGTIDGNNQGAMGVDPDALTGSARVEMVEGSLDDLDDRSMIIDEDRAKDQGLEVGDTVKFAMPARSTDFTVVGIFEPNPMLGFPYVTSLKAMADGGFPVADNYVYIDAADDADLTQVRSELDEITENLKLVTVKDQNGLAEEQRGPIDKALLLIYGLLALALVIAVLGIVNTLALSVIERTREVGLLRAIGLSRRQLRTMIRLESVVIAVLGAVLGTVLGLIFGVVLMRDLRDQGLEVVDVPYAQLGSFLVISVFIGVLAAVFPARRAARLDVLEAIATD
ncbi:MAG: ABC transporter permease [Nocardioides sp.]|nr:ABC transporter permease [Nocardioides sp.]